MHRFILACQFNRKVHRNLSKRNMRIQVVYWLGIDQGKSPLYGMFKPEIHS